MKLFDIFLLDTSPKVYLTLKAGNHLLRLPTTTL